MKYLLTILIILIMTASAFAYDPNTVVTAEDPIHMEFNNHRLTVTIFMTEEQEHVYSRINPISDIIKSIRAVMERRIAIYRRAWLESQNTTDME